MNNPDDEAQKILKDLEDIPNDVDTLYKLGVVYLSMKQVKRAEEVFKQCIQFDKKHSRALGDLGIVYLLLGKPKKAIKHLKKSLEIF